MGICTCNLLCWSASYLWLQKSQRSLWSQQLRLCVLRVLPSACYYNVARNQGFEVLARNGIWIMVLFGMCLPWFQCGAARWRPFFLRAQNGQNELCFWLCRVHLDRSDLFMKKIVDTRHMIVPLPFQSHINLLPHALELRSSSWFQAYSTIPCSRRTKAEFILSYCSYQISRGVTSKLATFVPWSALVFGRCLHF